MMSWPMIWSNDATGESWTRVTPARRLLKAMDCCSDDPVQELETAKAKGNAAHPDWKAQRGGPGKKGS